MKGKPNKFVWEALNFADHGVRGGDRRNRAVLSAALFVDLDYGEWAQSPFLVD